MYIGIDLGTSSVKCVLVDPDQKVLASASEALEVTRPAPTHSEQDPASWWQSTLKALDRLAAEHPKAMSDVRGIGLSGQMHGATLLDAKDQVLRPCILWNDARSFRECEDIETAEPEARAISGSDPTWPLIISTTLPTTSAGVGAGARGRLGLAAPSR